MVVLIGFLLWGLTAWACIAAFKTLRSTEAWPGRALYAVWAILILAALAFLMRPEEEITTGEDPAAYFHSAQAFARHGTITFQDPALAELPREHRSLFRYGHHGFGNTKDACLWIKNTDTAEVGSWFQPAFPLLLSLPIALFSPWSAFGVAPLFALLAALMLAGLARRITDSHTVAMLAFTLFLLHPAMAWNARCMRPEMPALFLALTGCAALATYDARTRRSFASGCASGLALSVAVLFHITVVYIALPAVWLAAWLQGQAARIRHAADEKDGRETHDRFWPGWWTGMVLGGMALAWQTISITDPYNLGPTFSSPGRRPFLIAAAALFAAGALALRYAPWHKVLLAIKPLRHRRAPMLASGAVALLYIGAALWIFMHRTDLGHVPGLPRWLTAYLSLTDFRGIVNLSSRFWSLMALTGVFCLLTLGRGMIGPARKRLFLLLAPASLTIGWMFNYMFETRRTTTALIPLMILASASLLDAIRTAVPALADYLQKRTALPAKRWTSWLRLQMVLPCLLALGLAGAAMRGRTALYTLRNHRGTFDHYKALSNRIAESGDFVFAEYTQTAAPIEHFSGLPLLPLAWDYRSDEDYRLAEEALANLVRTKPNQRYLMASPFTGIILPGLTLKPLFSQTLATRRLARTRGTIPSYIQKRTLTMHVHEVLPNDKALDNVTPYVRIMDGSRLGLSGAAKAMPASDITFRGVHIRPEEKAIIPFDPSIAVSDANHGKRTSAWVLVFAFPSFNATGTLSVTSHGVILPVKRTRLCPGWETIEIDDAALSAESNAWEIVSSEEAYLVQILRKPEDGGIGMPHPLRSTTTPFIMPNMDSQWLRHQAALALPHLNAPTALWMLATTGRDDGSTGALTMQPRDEKELVFEHTLVSGWHWHVAFLKDSGRTNSPTQWYDLHVHPPWDPKTAGFPDDLGVRVHAVILQRGPSIARGTSIRHPAGGGQNHFP